MSPRLHRLSYLSVKVLFSMFMLFSAIGELSFHPTVVDSLRQLQMPLYLLYFLGTAKILGVLAIWFSPWVWLQEWAYAGFVFDFLGALFGFFATLSFIFPDVIMAPLGLVLCLISYILSKSGSIEEEYLVK